MNDRGLLLWLWLAEVLGPCSVKLRPLLDSFVFLDRIYEARKSNELMVKLSPGEFARAGRISLDDMAGRLDDCLTLGITPLAYNDERYPQRLRDTGAPPTVLYASGHIEALCGQNIAGVGSRRISRYGREAVRLICEPLARAGITLVSGLAYGTDSEVHRAALGCGGKTIAVLGNGIDETVPNDHLQLRADIERDGAVVSEYPPGAGCKSYMFPARNRIISGLSRAVVIFEAAERSGTMITAGWALEDGREVFAVPGNITSPLSKGTNNLLRQGATPATGAGDILEALGLEGFESYEQTSLELPARPKLSGIEGAIADALLGGEIGLDELVAATGRTAGELLPRLTMLELSGHISSLPGGRYALKNTF